MSSKRFIARFGLDNSANSITNLGVSGASLTQSGAFALTLTTTANTTATLPSGAITLVDTSSTQALTNKTLNGLTVSTTTGTLSLANGSTLATSGAFSTTLTATAATNVTLPTTGTLATLAGTETFTNKTLTTPTIDGASLSGTFSGTPTFSGNVTFSSGTTNFNAGATGTYNLATDVTTGTINLFSGVTGTLNIGAANSTTVIKGNLTVDGITTTVNSTTVTVDDKNLELGSVATPTDATADGGGITLKGATDKSIIWDSANNNWTLSENVNLPTGKVFKINNTSVLSATTLGTGVVSSSLTSVGTLTTGVWNASIINPAFGGTGNAAPTADGQLLIGSAAGTYTRATLTQGTGISITNGAGSITISNADTGSAQNIFKNIAVSGQSTISADNNDDTLTLVAGSGIAITTDGPNDSITIAVAGGAGTPNAVPNSLVSRDGNGESAFRGVKINTADTTEIGHIDAQTATVTTTAPTTIYSMSASLYKVGRLVIKALQGTTYNVTEILYVTDGTNVDHTEYGAVNLGAAGTIATYSLIVTGGNVVVQVSQAAATSTSYNTIALSLV